MAGDGLTVLLTRPAAQSRRFADQVRDRLGPGVRVVIAPLMRIVPLGPLPAMAAGDVPVFTSESGAEAFAALGGRCAGPAYAVGGRTAAVTRRLGFAPVTEGPGDGAGLAGLIAAERPAGNGTLWHLHGTHVAGDVAAMLQARGIRARDAAIYDQVAEPLSAEATDLLAGERPVLVPVFSARTARLLAGDLARARAPLGLAAISPAVAGQLPVQIAAKVAVAARAEAAAVLDVLADLAGNPRFLEGRHRPG
jgi:uroporphyrinogen-III synthase